MSRPRQVLCGSLYLITRRCTQRQLLLRPDDATNNAYLYCLIVAAQRSAINVIVMCAMSNHHHVVIHDPEGRYPEFIEHFHKMLARSQNALRGRWENFWASGQTSVVRLSDTEDLIRKAVYVATNPVKDGLVERTHHWPGVNGYGALTRGTTLHAQRPRHFFRAGGATPQSVSMNLAIPTVVGDHEAIRCEIEARVRALEERLKDERLRTGRKLLGRSGVLRESWRTIPTTVAPHRVLNPRIAAKNASARVEAIEQCRSFVRAYRRARASWIAGLSVAFPSGTYWLRRFAKVPIDVGIADTHVAA